MKLLLWTEDDPASVLLAKSIRRQYGDVVPQPRHAHYGGPEVLAEWDAVLAEVEGSLLAADHIDRSVATLGRFTFDRALFLSKHSASSGRRSFAVHPVGNWGDDTSFGGKARTLAPSDPEALRAIFLALAKEAAPSRVPVTLESTHHGPVMEIPSLFVEVGSSAAEWEDEDAADTVARAVVRGYLGAPLPPEDSPVLGVGGGHYHPLHGDAVARDKLAFGHLLPRHAFGDATPEILREAVRLSRARRYLVDERQAGADSLNRITGALDSMGLSRIRGPV